MDTNLNEVVFYILIVDDDKDDLFFLTKAINLVMPNAIVDLVSDGDLVLEFLSSCTALPNVIFMDIKMPRVSGQEAVKRIRSNTNLRTIPIVILSGSTSDKEKEELLNLGANRFYTKPMEPVNLIPIVKEVNEEWLQPVLSYSTR